MSIESELKILPREEINKESLLQLLEKHGYEIVGELETRLQEDSYFDDKESNLSKNGCSFRIRKNGTKIIVTCKIPQKSNLGYKQREEWEEQIPKEYIDENGNVLLEDAIKILKQSNPNIVLPTNLELVIKVYNNRDKINIKTLDETVIELVFDKLSAKDKEGALFSMKDEIEFEVLSGNTKELNDIYQIIDDNYVVEKNNLSKYSRALEEVREQKDNMSLDEITTCTMLSAIIRTNEFNQLKYKGQMIHDYRITIPDNLSLDNFKDSKYLISKISEVKRTKNYKPGKIKTLEDMFLCFFSDMDYKDIEYRLVNFLNDNYYKEGTPITNRMLHSQQVMLITGLISKSNEISSAEKNTLLCMVSALIHDIGHVPGAHPTEEILAEIDGFFSHEINGRNVIEKIISRNEIEIIDEIKQYYLSTGKQYDEDKILECIQNNKSQMKKSIECHSRTNSERRGEGTVVQLPREADKICYATSDIVDIIKRFNEDGKEHIVEFFPKEWKEKVSIKIGKNYDRKNIITQKIIDIERMIQTKNFGLITTSIANSIRENMNDGKIYYDVEQDIWDILDSTIKYIKDLRREGRIENKRKELKYSAAYFILRKFNKVLKECGGNIENAWERTLDEITNSNDIDILNSVNEIKTILGNDEKKFVEAFSPGGVLDITDIRKLYNADRQIKMQPQGKFQMSDLLPNMGNQYNILPTEKIRDTYFDSGEENISICVREYENTGKKSLIAKIKRDKAGVTQVERKKYVMEGYNRNSIEELVEQFNNKHRELKINVPQGKPKCIINTIRSNAENEDNIIIRRDKSKVIAGDKEIEMPETIEIECNDKELMKKVKQQLNEFLDSQNINMKSVSTKETKEEQAMRLLQERLFDSGEKHI